MTHLPPQAALTEEFGDLLAEGLYAFISEEDPSVPFDVQLRAATEAYWSAFIDARHQVLAETKALLLKSLERTERNNYVPSAVSSLAAAENQLDTITPDLCMSFIDAWRDDLADWQRFSSGVNNVGSIGEAMDFLELKTWIQCAYGAAAVESQTVRWSAHGSQQARDPQFEASLMPPEGWEEVRPGLAEPVAPLDPALAEVGEVEHDDTSTVSPAPSVSRATGRRRIANSASSRPGADRRTLVPMSTAARCGQSGRTGPVSRRARRTGRSSGTRPACRA